MSWLIWCSYLSAWGGTFLGLLWGTGSLERLPGGLGWRREWNRSVWVIVSCNSNNFSSSIRHGEGGCGGASLWFPDYFTRREMNSPCPTCGWDRATPAWTCGALCASLPSPDPSKHPRVCLSPAALCCRASLYKDFQIRRCPLQHHNPRLRSPAPSFVAEARGRPARLVWKRGSARRARSAAQGSGWRGRLRRHMFLRSSRQLPAEQPVLLTSAEPATSGTAAQGSAVLFWVQTRAESIGPSGAEG